MQIVIPFKTPTVNHLYTRNRFGNRCKTTEANKLKKEITEIVKNSQWDPLEDTELKLKVEIEIHENWYCKNGTIKRKDLMNREKFIVDCVFEALEIDDRRIFEHKMIKVQNEEEKAVINIEAMK